MASLTAEAPDPKTFESWEDAFKYPIPAVRRMEQQLRSDISSNRERLRTLVGSSYRDLLGTADSIIQMDGQMHDVEAHLGDITRRCNTRLVERHSKNHSNLLRDFGTEERWHNADLSQLAVLRRCPDQVSLILRRGGSLLLAAKILVLSRLLHRKASTNSSAATFVEKTRVRLGKLRQKLLATIDRRIANLDLNESDVIDALCAFSLATSSSTSDILRHFHHVRLSAISTDFQVAVAQDSDVFRRLNIFIRTVQDTQSLFPHRVSTTLSKLKSKPLLKDDGLRDGEDFNLDLHENWVDEDIKNFMPYIRHDDLKVSAAAESLSVWTPKALDAYSEGLKKFLDKVESFQDVLDLRTKCLQLWLDCKGRLIGTSKSETLDSLRQVFQDRLDALLKAWARSIGAVSEKIRGIALFQDNKQPEVSALALWRDELVNMDATREAQNFTNTIDATYRGRTEQLSATMKIYYKWKDDLTSIREAISSMRNIRWELDALDEDEDGGTYDDAEDMRYRLEKDDVQDLERAYGDWVAKAMFQLEIDVTDHSKGLLVGHSRVENSVLLLRITRGIKEKLPPGLDISAVQFAYIGELHKNLAGQVAERCRHVLTGKFMAMGLPGRLLWDGKPELPTVPSPWSYRFLKAMQKNLSNVGSDIWTQSAIQELKKAARNILVEELSRPDNEVISATIQRRNHLTSSESVLNGEYTSDDGNGEAVDNSESVRESRIQMLFDLLYLGEAFSIGDAPDDAFHSHFTRIQSDVGLTADLISRLQGTSRAYWKRTGLIFGLLA